MSCGNDANRIPRIEVVAATFYFLESIICMAYIMHVIVLVFVAVMVVIVIAK